MIYYCDSSTKYKRLSTRAVKTGELISGNSHPIRLQAAVFLDKEDAETTVKKVVRFIDAGVELISINVRNKLQVEKLSLFRNALRNRSFLTPISVCIDSSFDEAEETAPLAEAIQVNLKTLTGQGTSGEREDDSSANAANIQHKFLSLIKICKSAGTAIAIDVFSPVAKNKRDNHHRERTEIILSLLRLAREENFHQILLGIRTNSPLATIHACRQLVQQMKKTFNECYPLQLGLTIDESKFSLSVENLMGVGALLEDGIGDVLAFSFQEESISKISFGRELSNYFNKQKSGFPSDPPAFNPAYSPVIYRQRKTQKTENIGGEKPPAVIADFSERKPSKTGLQSIGYSYKEASDTWETEENAADYIYTSGRYLPFAPPPGLRVLCDAQVYEHAPCKNKYFPLFTSETWLQKLDPSSEVLNFISIDCKQIPIDNWNALLKEESNTRVFCMYASGKSAMHAVREKVNELWLRKLKVPVILCIESLEATTEKQLVHFSCEAGALLLDGMGDGLWLKNHPDLMKPADPSGQILPQVKDNSHFLNNVASSIVHVLK